MEIVSTVRSFQPEEVVPTDKIVTTVADATGKSPLVDDIITAENNLTTPSSIPHPIKSNDTPFLLTFVLKGSQTPKLIHPG